jgi:UDP-glucose 4-epimerase
VVVARLFNVVGPRQTGAYGMVLPRLVDAALASRPLVVHDDGRQERCFAHVSDVVRMILGLMAAPAAVGGVCNVGSDRPVSILDLARRVVAIVEEAGTEDPKSEIPRPSPLRIEFQSYAEAYGDDFEDCRRRVPDLTKLRRLTGLQARYGLDDIIRELVAWKRGSQQAHRA